MIVWLGGCSKDCCSHSCTQKSTVGSLLCDDARDLGVGVLIFKLFLSSDSFYDFKYL